MTERELIDALAEIRRKRGLTQHSVAIRMGLAGPSSISHLERHRRGRSINLDTLLRYAHAVGAELTARVVV